eukprot:1942550-Prymnesium_polylepis.1
MARAGRGAAAAPAADAIPPGQPDIGATVVNIYFAAGCVHICAYGKKCSDARVTRVSQRARRFPVGSSADRDQGFDCGIAFRSLCVPGSRAD